MKSVAATGGDVLSDVVGVKALGRIAVDLFKGRDIDRRVGFCGTGFVRQNEIIETLQKVPLDLIGYRMDNRHRLDIVFDPTPGQVVNEGWRPVNPVRPQNVFEKAEDYRLKVGWHVNGSALPIDERCHVRLDRDGFALDATEGNGYSEHEGTIYLLPYYMARYHGIIN